LQRIHNLPAERSQLLLSRLAANAERLEQLVLDLPDLDRLKRGVVEPRRRPTEIAQLVMRVLDSIPETCNVATAEVEAIVADIDAAHVERILENLMVNAVRHTPDGTRVWVRARRIPEGVLLSVEDDGPGVPDRLKTDVFAAFRNGDDSAPKPGVGLGLALVAQLAQLHGGRAWVEDRPGGGASFRVVLKDGAESKDGRQSTSVRP
jgi:NtrC-family two-component system sensor histidine kinase KinB